MAGYNSATSLYKSEELPGMLVQSNRGREAHCDLHARGWAGADADLGADHERLLARHGRLQLVVQPIQAHIIQAVLQLLEIKAILGGLRILHF